MRSFILGVVLFGLSTGIGQASPKLGSDAAIVLATQGEDLIPGPIWCGAKTTVLSIFEDVGVRVVWRGANANSNISSKQIPILIQVAARLSPALEERGPKCADTVAFACSWPFDMSARGRIVVMYERLRPFSVRSRLFPRLIGYLIAHEVTHILQRRAHHSDTGIMKQHWTGGDFAEIETARLAFTARDIGFIEEGLNSRFERR